VEAVRSGGRGGWLKPAARLRRVEAGFVGCGGDTDSDRPGCGGGVIVVVAAAAAAAAAAAVDARAGAPAANGMVGADMEPVGGVREPSLAAVDAWENSSRD